MGFSVLPVRGDIYVQLFLVRQLDSCVGLGGLGLGVGMGAVCWELGEFVHGI